MIETVAKFQTLIAGLLALGAAWAIVTEGKRDRDFRTNQHKIEMENKRYAVAVMLTAYIWSVVEMASVKSLVKKAKEEKGKLKRLGENDDESLTLPIFPNIDKSFLNNYSLYIENMPLMRVKTVQEVSRFYLRATNLFYGIESSNAKMEGTANNKTRISSLGYVHHVAEITQNQFEETLPLLKKEAAIAEKELARLEMRKRKISRKRTFVPLHAPAFRRLLKIKVKVSFRRLLRMRAGVSKNPK